MKREAIICDIDNTIFDMTQRYHLLDGANTDWDKFLDEDLILQDRPISNVIKVIECLSAKYPIIFVSGRNEGIRSVTEKQISSYLSLLCGYELFMRRDEDRGRSDVEIKREIYEEKVHPKYEIIACFDDKTSVINLWRELGLIACHTGELATGDGF